VLEPGDPNAERGPVAPRSMRIAALVAVAQAVGLAVFAAVVVVQALRGDRSSVTNVLLLVVLLLAWAAALVLCARGLLHRRRWARAPLVLSELLLLAVGIPLVQGDGARWAGVLLVGGAVVGLLSVLSPAVTAELET
jgi:hypothetical protein